MAETAIPGRSPLLHLVTAVPQPSRSLSTAVLRPLLNLHPQPQWRQIPQKLTIYPSNNTLK